MTSQCWLPPEVWTMVFQMFSEEDCDIESVRLTCKSFEELATPFLLPPPRIICAPLSGSLATLTAVSRHPVLSKSVKEIVYDCNRYHFVESITEYKEALRRADGFKEPKSDEENRGLKTAFSQYRQTYDDQARMENSGEVIACLCSALMRMPHIKEITISPNFDCFLDSQSDSIYFLEPDPAYNEAFLLMARVLSLTETQPKRFSRSPEKTFWHLKGYVPLLCLPYEWFVENPSRRIKIISFPSAHLNRLSFGKTWGGLQGHLLETRIEELPSQRWFSPALGIVHSQLIIPDAHAAPQSLESQPPRARAPPPTTAASDRPCPSSRPRRPPAPRAALRPPRAHSMLRLTAASNRRCPLSRPQRHPALRAASQPPHARSMPPKIAASDRPCLSSRLQRPPAPRAALRPPRARSMPLKTAASDRPCPSSRPQRPPAPRAVSQPPRARYPLPTTAASNHSCPSSRPRRPPVPRAASRPPRAPSPPPKTAASDRPRLFETDMACRDKLRRQLDKWWHRGDIEYPWRQRRRMATPSNDPKPRSTPVHGVPKPACMGDNQRSHNTTPPTNYVNGSSQTTLPTGEAGPTVFEGDFPLRVSAATSDLAKTPCPGGIGIHSMIGMAYRC
ncbi:hypothetical protein V499_00608 [Pseudogymnoascus sp. VKM F-103]|nr:hypothetical protein V499_00608 [Pseudogymnoascus sp. VKM F-103]